jgi:LacI family transcriptional regulator
VLERQPSTVNKKKDITIYDIADRLSISAATVSRALQNHRSVNEETRKKVLHVANKLGYQSNTFARNLRMKSTNTIGFLVHELNSNFITSVLAGVEKITTRAGYDLIIAHSSESYIKEVANVMNLFHKRVDGVIASLAFDTTDMDHFKVFHKKSIPLVFFDRVEKGNMNTAVVIDNYKAGYEATEHLIKQGCRKIVIVTANLNRNVYADRFRGYKDALFDNGIGFDERLLIVNDLSETAAVESAHRILAMRPIPDGLFATHDFSAAVCMQVLKENGINVPSDIAIVGFNNDAISKLVEPNLTTIDYPGKYMGEIAAQNLIEQLKGKDIVQRTSTVVINSGLIIRGSSLRKHGT